MTMLSIHSTSRNERFVSRRFTFSSVVWLFILVLASVLLFPGDATGEPKSAKKHSREQRVAESRVIVRFRDGPHSARAREAMAHSGTRELKSMRRLGVSVLEVVDKGRSLDSVIQALETAPGIVFAEPDYLVETMRLPADPQYPEQWALAAISAEEAWDITTGDSSIVVAVIDTGVDYTHPDLAARMWVNPAEVVNGLDDDGNGYVDDIHGINAITGSGDPFDDNRHGTHVAGTIGAETDNDEGIAGVDWNARIMALKFIGASGFGNTSDALECMEYVLEMKTQFGVDVRLTNNSWGGGGFSYSLYQAIAASGEAGMLFVAAAGNNYGRDNDASPHYPSSFDLPNVVAVAATNSSDVLAPFSNVGAQSVHLAAPGENILSSVPGSGYAYLRGTSMAAPHVSGAAALIWSRFPAAPPEGVRELLMSSTDPLPALEGRMVSGGRLNLLQTVSCTPGVGYLRPSPGDGFAFERGTEQTLRLTLSDCAELIPGATVTVTPSDGSDPLTAYDDGIAPDLRADDGTYTALWTPELEGSVTLQVDAAFSGGAIIAAISGTVLHVPSYGFAAAAPFRWLEANTATSVSLGDEQSVEIPIGFEFEFYGETHSNVSISSNGYLTFDGNGTEHFNTPLPNAAVPNAVIAPYWDDLNPSMGGEIHYHLEGSAPTRRLVITWTEVPYYFYGGAVTFQAVLHEADGSIEINHAETVSGVASDLGASATVGIEDASGARGLQYSHNAPVVPSQASVVIFDEDRCPGASDSDGDRVCDARDNCTVVANPDQRDTDRDGFGNACDADYDNNGAVGTSDFGAIVPVFGTQLGDPGYSPLFDHTEDGAIGIPDFATLTQQFGGPPGPSGLSCAGTVSCEAP
jgi:subtilisin family serine protease